MKKNRFIKYMLCMMFAFCLFMPTFKADGDYQFYCDYKMIASRGSNTMKTVSFPIRVYYYGDETIKVYSNNKEVEHKSKASNLYETLTSNPLDQFAYYPSEFVNSAKIGNMYTCPSASLILKSGSYAETQGQYDIIKLQFGNTDRTDNIFVPGEIVTKEPVFNSNVQNELSNKIKKAIDDCNNPISYEGEQIANFPYALEVKVNVYNTGEKEIVIVYYNKKVKEELSKNYDNTNGVVFSFPGDRKLIIPAGEEHLWFGSTCPTADKIYPAQSKTSNKEVIFTMNKETARNLGYYNEGDVLTSESMENIQSKNLNVNVSSRIGFCTDYLGPASTDGTVANLLDEIFDIVKIVSIILVIILSMLEFAKVTTGSKDELMAAVKKLVTRLIVLGILLLLPTFIDMIGNLLGIEEILCGIR